MNGEPTTSETGEYASELLDAISDVLGVLSAVSQGDLSPRLAFEYPDTHPVGALAGRVRMISSTPGNSGARPAYRSGVMLTPRASRTSARVTRRSPSDSMVRPWKRQKTSR